MCVSALTATASRDIREVAPTPKSVRDLHTNRPVHLGLNALCTRFVQVSYCAARRKTCTVEKKYLALQRAMVFGVGATKSEVEWNARALG